MNEGRISARRDRSNLLVTKGPDVCLTPRGGEMVPAAYSSVAFLGQAIRVSKSVRNNGRYDFQLNSRTTEIKGHEPGTGKGKVVPGYKTYSHVRIASGFVYSEGFATVSHRDPAWINHPDPGPTEPQKDKHQVELAANTTTNFKYACKALGIDPIDASDALHAARDSVKVPANGNYNFDQSTGDIFYGGEHIGNLRD